MSCEPPNEIAGGKCLQPCPANQRPQGDSKEQCIQVCPPGFLESDSGCIRPQFPRDSKPPLKCPLNATRIGDQCWLECPEGTVADFEICVPVCPQGFVESGNGAVCESEFIRRQSSPRAACYPGETRLNNVCQLPCPAGMTPQEADPALCKQVVPANVKKFFETEGFISSKIKFGRIRVNAVCEEGQEPIANACQSVCPLNSDALNDQCIVRCPPPFVQFGTSCSRQLISRDQATGSQSFFSSLITIFVAILGITFVGLLLTFLFKSLSKKNEAPPAQA